MVIRGIAWKFGDFISTDLIAPGRYTHLRSNLPEYAKHCLETANPQFASEALKGEKTYIVVAGKAFGTGSSREHAARILKYCTPALLAKSFGRILYRNCFNIGLPALVVDTDQIEHNDEIEIDLEKGYVRNLTKNLELKIAPIHPLMLRILQEGGLIPYIKKYGDLVLDTPAGTQ